METNNTSISPQSHRRSSSRDLLATCKSAFLRFSNILMDKTEKFDVASNKFVERRGHISKVSSIVLLFIILVAIIGGICFLMLFRELPGFLINNVVAPKDPNENRFNIDFGAVNRSPSINLSVTLNVTVENRNGFRLFFPFVDVDVFHPQLTNVSLGKTSVKELELMPHSTIFITVPINLTYFFRDDPSSVVANTLLGACTLGTGQSEPDQNIDIALVLTPNLKLFNLFPTKVQKLNKFNSFGCPYKFPRSLSVGGVDVNLDKIDWKAFQKSDLITALLPTIAKLAS